MNSSNEMVQERGERLGTLRRGLSLLEIMSASPSPMTLGGLASASGLDQSTTLRLLRTLEEAGYVIRNDVERRYAPSPKLLAPLPLLHPLNQLRRESRVILTDLSHRLAQTVILVLFFGSERMVLDIATVPGSIAPYYGTWLEGPLHATGVGKALLSGIPFEDRARLLGDGPLERYTTKTITEMGALNDELEASVPSRYVVSREEYREGVTNVASLIRSWDGSVLGCLNVSASASGLNAESHEQIGAEVAKAVDLLMYQAPSLQAVSQFCRV